MGAAEAAFGASGRRGRSGEVITAQNRSYSWDDRLPYDAVTGRHIPEEMRAALEQASNQDGQS